MPQPLRMRQCKSCLRAQHAFASRSLHSPGDQCPVRRLHEQLQQRRCMAHTSAACQSILRSGCEPQRRVDGASNEEEDVTPYAWCAPGLQAPLLLCMPLWTAADDRGAGLLVDSNSPTWYWSQGAPAASADHWDGRCSSCRRGGFPDRSADAPLESRHVCGSWFERF